MPKKKNGDTFSFAVADEPPPAKPHKSSPQILLDWLLQHWTDPDICLRDIRAYAPAPVRDEKIAISSAEALARHGWLSELPARQRNRRVWRIDRKPIIDPIVPTE